MNKFKYGNLLRVILLFFSFFRIGVYSQTIDSISNPLEKVFQTSFDSTISFHAYSAWGDKGEYFFIGKKSDTIYYYRYFNPIKNLKKNIGPYESSLSQSLKNNHYKYIGSDYYKTINIDDRFFWVFTEISKGSLWAKIQNENMWNLVENKKIKQLSFDGSEFEFKLITQDKVIKLYYYSPEDYPISELYHVQNRVNEVVKEIYNFFKKHQIEFTSNQF
jgi:hypothetical protein